MKKKRFGLILGSVLVVLSPLWIGSGTADVSTVIGDVSILAECLGVEPRAGIYHVSDILCELAKRMDLYCCSGCPEEPGRPEPGDVIVSRVLPDPPGSGLGTEIPSEYVAFRNVSACPVDLRGCQFRDEQSSWTIPADWVDAILKPREEAVFYGSDYNPTNDTSGIVLRDSGETITLLCGFTTIDQWQYPGTSADGEVLYRPGY